MNANKLLGIGFRHPHYYEVLETLPDIGWFEVHSENFFHRGGAAMEILFALRQHYPLSLHGVGLSLGSAAGIDQQHLAAIKTLAEKVDPFLLSEHLSWSHVNGIQLPDLLPIPYTSESLAIFCRNVEICQDYLGRELLIENPSSYLQYQASHLEEVEFLVTLCQRTGAKILLDVNNVFVSCSNHQWDAKAYLDAIPASLVQEIHLAGHTVKSLSSQQLVRIDTHDHAVCAEVWELYDYAIAKLGPQYTLLEWDAEIPSLTDLITEAEKVLPYLTKERCSNVSA